MSKKVIETICCPQHTEKTPSFAIYSDGTFHCFGCGLSGKWTDEGDSYGFAFLTTPDGKTVSV
jgi:hypothetical protein